MKSILLKVPENLEFSALDPKIQLKIAELIGAWTVVGRPFNGMKILDCLVSDEFTPDILVQYGLNDWEVMGMWEFSGESEVDSSKTVKTSIRIVNGKPVIEAREVALLAPEQPVKTLIPPDFSVLMDFYPDEPVLDANGNIVDFVRPTQPYELHRWDGWPPRHAT